MIGIAAGALCCVLLTIGLLVKFVCMPAVKVWSHPHPAETQTGVYTDGHAGLHHLHAAGDAVIMMAHHAPDGKVTMTPAPHGTNLQHLHAAGDAIRVMAQHGDVSDPAGAGPSRDDVRNAIKAKAGRKSTAKM